MHRTKWMGLAVAAALLAAAASSGAMAQAHRYATGGTPTPADQKQSIPQAPVFRNFLPPMRLLAGLALMTLAGYFGYELRGQFSGAMTAVVGLFSKKAATDGFDETAAPVVLAIFGVLLLVAGR